jgi:hypothetical protein
MLLNPRFDCCPLPDAASCQFGVGFGEVRVALGDLMDALRANTEYLSDLLRSHEMMGHSARVLDVP